MTRNNNDNVSDWIEDATILKVLTGSRGYGVASDDSDKDIAGVVIPPKELLLGLQKFKHYSNTEYTEGKSSKGKTEAILFGLHRFFELAMGMKSCAIEVLFAHPDVMLKCTEAGRILLNNREKFLNSSIYQSLRGHAFSTERFLKGMSMQYSDDYHVRASKKYYLIFTILYVGIEALETGVINIRREKEAEFLYEVKAGKVSTELTDKEKNKLFRRMDTAYLNTKLPHFPNYNELNDVLIELALTSINSN